MIIETIFTNFLLHTDVSFESKKMGSEVFIGKTTAQNTNHQWDDMLAEFLPVHQDFFGDITNVLLKIGIQKTQTKLVNKVMADFSARCTLLDAYFISTKLRNDPLYDTFFPLGVQAYTHNVDKGAIESYLGAMVGAITDHTTEAGGIAVLHEFQAFQSSYATSRNLQTQKMGATRAARTNRNEAELAWADKLFSNILVLANTFRNQPEKVNDFFTQHYFQRSHSKHSEHVGTLTGMATRGHTVIPEPEVLVHVVDGNIADCYTKADGTFRTQKLKVGFYKVQFSKAGFVTQEITIEIRNDEETIADAIMEMSTQEIS